jgi:hypothetical protein
VQTTNSALSTDYEDSDGSENEDYSRFIRREMPPGVRRELESLPDHEFQSRESLINRLVEIISRMQSRPHDVYQQSIVPAPLHEQGAQSTEPTASSSGSGTTPSASASLTTPTPPPAPELLVNADEFANSLRGLEFDVGDFDMDPEEFQRLMDEWGPPDDRVNDGKAT